MESRTGNIVAAPGQYLGPTLGISQNTWTKHWEEAYPEAADAVNEPAIDGFATTPIDVERPCFQVCQAHPPDKSPFWDHIPVEQDGWVLAHNAIRHELSKFKRALQAVGNSPLEAWQLRAIKAYIQGHMVHVREHHRNEDNIFNPELRKRINYPDKLEADHAVLVQLMAEIDEVTSNLSSGSNIAELTALWTKYEAAMLPHLHEEEVIGLPLARAYFTPKEVSAIVAKMLKDASPISLGSFVHALGSKQDAKRFMKQEGIPGFVWFLPVKGFKALRTLYRRKMESHVESLIAGRVVNSVHKVKRAQQSISWDENRVAQAASPEKQVDVKILGARTS